MWWSVLVGCALLEDPPPRNCARRVAFYPDPDGDGIGDPSEVKIGCEAPDGWVTSAGEPDNTGTDSAGHTGDTGL